MNKIPRSQDIPTLSLVLVHVKFNFQELRTVIDAMVFVQDLAVVKKTFVRAVMCLRSRSAP